MIAASTKIQAGLASVIVAAAATITPGVAHATPGLAPIAQDEGNTGNASSQSDQGNTSGRAGNSGNQNQSGTSGSDTSDAGTTSSGKSDAGKAGSGRAGAGRSGSDTSRSDTPGAATSVTPPEIQGSLSPAPGDTQQSTPRANANVGAGPIENLVRVTVQIGAQVTWGLLDTTAGVIKLVGEIVSVIPIIGPVIGNVFTVVADSLHNAAYAVAQNFQVGPYLNYG